MSMIITGITVVRTAFRLAVCYSHLKLFVKDTDVVLELSVREWTLGERALVERRRAKCFLAI